MIYYVNGQKKLKKKDSRKKVSSMNILTTFFLPVLLSSVLPQDLPVGLRGYFLFMLKLVLSIGLDKEVAIMSWFCFKGHRFFYGFFFDEISLNWFP